MQTDAQKRRKNGGCIAIVLVVTLLSIASAYFFGSQPLYSANASDACTMAQKFVKQSLKAPSTARFAPCREPETVVTQTHRIWHVRSWVDAQNGFGAQLRTHYTASLIYYPATDRWTLTDLSLD